MADVPAGCVQVGWAYQDRNWADGRWHPCQSKPVQIKGRLVRPIFIQEETTGETGWRKLEKLTFAVQHNPNCPSPWLVRLPGKGPIDMKHYGDPLGLTKPETGDILGFGKTFDEAADAALAVKEMNQ